MKRKDIRPASIEEKEKVYQEVLDLSKKQGIKVKVEAHRSGFPAVTLDCGDLHYLTDCLSMEDWTRKRQSKEKGNDAEG